MLKKISVKNTCIIKRNNVLIMILTSELSPLLYKKMNLNFIKKYVKTKIFVV